jgi:hyperosmotically inducible protein
MAEDSRLARRLRTGGVVFSRKETRMTHKLAGLTLAVTAALAFAHAGMAQSGKGAGNDVNNPANPKFEKLDRNNDGFLSKDEVRDIRDYGKAFDAADANKDGKLDRAEFTSAESMHSRMAAGNYVEDSVLTAKVKAALLKEKNLKSTDVSVETLHGEVILSGFVRSEDQRQKAKSAAAAVNGVASVKDAMVVR